MTWNTLYASASSPMGSWNARAPLVVETVSAEQPDVLGLQEMDPTQLDFARAGFAGYTALLGQPTGVSKHPHQIRILAPFALLAAALLWARVGPPPWSPGVALIQVMLVSFGVIGPVVLFALERYRGPFREPGEFLPLLYRADRLRALEDGTLWLSNTPHRPQSMFPLLFEPRAVHWARFETIEGGVPLLMINAHLGHAPWHYAGSAKILLELIARERPAPDAPVILMGDFNAVPEADVMRRLRGTMGDAWSDAGARDGTGPTFQWYLARGMTPLRLDHVLYAGPVLPIAARVLAPRVGGLPPSDHDPLVVDFELSVTAR
jgi:endonuclease/exonuclease/phosphatase family metal-dependent hydrolase